MVLSLLLLFPLQVMGAGNGEISSMYTNNTFPTSGSGDLGGIKVTIPAFTTLSDDELAVTLPADVSLARDDNGEIRDPFDLTGKNKLRYFAKNGGSVSDLNGDEPGTAELFVKRAEADSFLLAIRSDEAVTLSEEAVLFIELGDATWDDLNEGALEVTLEAPGSSVFPTGKVTLGTVGGDSVILVGAEYVQFGGDRFTFVLVLIEQAPGRLKVQDDAIQLQLPAGYEWITGTGTRRVEPLRAGKDMYFRMSGEQDLLTIDVLGTATDDNQVPPTGVTSATYESTEYAIAYVPFQVTDPSKVKPGPIMAKVSGKADVSADTVQVGVYQEGFGPTLTAANPEALPTLVAGQDEQRIADMIIHEAVSGSLTLGRTVELTLPEKVAFQSVVDGEEEAPPAHRMKSQKDLKLTFLRYTGEDKRTAQFEVTGLSKELYPPEIGTFTLEDVEVAVAPDFTGDLVVKAGGNAGLKGEVKLANVVAPVSIDKKSSMNFTIGKQEQAINDIYILESASESLADNSRITLDLPEGVTFKATPTVDVYRGNIGITGVQLLNEGRTLTFDMEQESNEASTIQISKVRLNIDRMVPEGEISASLFLETPLSKAYSPFKDDNRIAILPLGTVITPAIVGMDVYKEVQVRFVVGSTEYSVNNRIEKTDLAPYVKEGRVYIPLRYAAHALGVGEKDVIWDASSQTATFIKSRSVIQFKAGSKVITINGVPVSFDAAPEITNGRFALPIRPAATCLQADIQWHEMDQSILIKTK